MDNYSKEDILKALAIIRDVCKQYDDCCSCPFYNNERCITQFKDPCDWIITDEYSIWRALK